MAQRAWCWVLPRQRASCCRLYDIMHTDTRLTLVFEYAEKDLKDYMTAHKQLLLREPFICKVSLLLL